MMSLGSLLGGVSSMIFGVHKLSLLTCAVLSHLSISGPKEDPFWGTFLVPKVVPEFLTPTGPPPCGSRAGRPATPQAARRRAVRRVPCWLRGSACVAGRAP